jgi:hypothetical protein
MSIFRTITLPCPACASPVVFELVISVSADRRPDLRDAILDGSFQRLRCPGCATEVRADPEFTYMDIGRRQYIGVWPSEKRREWKPWSEQTRAAFDDMLGRNAPPEAKQIGQKVDVRTVFGWHALVEKILAREAGVEDRLLELAKLTVMRTSAETPLPGELELRLVAFDESTLLLAWLGGAEEDPPPPAIRVPRQLLADIEADPGAWRETQDTIADGDVVDFQREMLLAV